jgi:hypothetical protein
MVKVYFLHKWRLENLRIYKQSRVKEQGDDNMDELSSLVGNFTHLKY